MIATVTMHPLGIAPETMFLPYISILSDMDDEQQHAKHRSSLYLYEVSAAIFIDCFQSTLLWMSCKHRLAP